MICCCVCDSCYMKSLFPVRNWKIDFSHKTTVIFKPLTAMNNDNKPPSCIKVSKHPDRKLWIGRYCPTYQL